MQIRVVLGVNDQRYLNNLVMFLEKNYLDKLEILSFSRPDMLQNYFLNGTADVILVDENFGIKAESLSAYGKTAYLCDSVSETTKDGFRLLAKFKKPDLIYKDILDLYAEGGMRSSFRSGVSKHGKNVLVTSFSGGTGASMFAAALAKKYASRGKKTLYLNLEMTGSSADFFSGSGNYRFEEVIFALKSQKADVLLKMESAVRVDRSGVYYFEPCTTAMYMLELNHDDIMKILEVLQRSDYDCIVFDMNFALTKDFMEVMSYMDQIILVQDGNDTSNTKFERTIEALQIMEGQNQIKVMPQMSLIYNRFSSSKSSNEIPNLPFPVIGKIPPIKHAVSGEIMDYILTLQDLFENLQ